MSQATQTSTDPVARVGAIRRVLRAIRDKANALMRKTVASKDADMAEQIRSKIAGNN